MLNSLTNYFKGEINKEYLNPNKVRSLKMLFLDSVKSCSLKWAHSLNQSKFSLIKRTTHYRLFDEGLKKYEEETSIVQVLRDLRYYRAAVDGLMSEKPLKD